MTHSNWDIWRLLETRGYINYFRPNHYFFHCEVLNALICSFNSLTAKWQYTSGGQVELAQC